MLAPSTQPHFYGQLVLKPWRAAYVQPSRRPTDGRYGENPNRLQHYYQFQVLLKPNPDNIQDLYLDSLRELGIDPLVHDIRFVEDNWESPTLGAWGLGWEIWLNGMEVTQFTYFQQVGGLDCKPVSGEITYGLERNRHVPARRRKCFRSGLGRRAGRRGHFTVMCFIRTKWKCRLTISNTPTRMSCLNFSIIARQKANNKSKTACHYPLTS